MCTTEVCTTEERVRYEKTVSEFRPYMASPLQICRCISTVFRHFVWYQIRMWECLVSSKVVTVIVVFGLEGTKRQLPFALNCGWISEV